MKFCAKIGSFILGIVIGIVLVFGGVGIAGFVVLTKEGMVGTIADSIGGGIFNPTEEIAQKSLLEYGKTVVETIQKFDTVTFGELEDTVGINITTTLADAVGLDSEVLRTSNVGNVADNILNGFTITTLQDRFGFSLPDMPMFEDPNFKSKPILEAFDYLSAQLDFDQMKVSDLYTKLGVDLGEFLGKEEFADIAINDLGDEVMKMPLRNFIAITLTVEVDRYLAEHVATATAIDGVTYGSLAEWTEGKTAFEKAADGSNLGAGAYVFDTPEGFFTSSVYFATAEDQAAWLVAYNEGKEEGEKAVEFWSYAIENRDLYNAVMEDNFDYIKEWTKAQWKKDNAEGTDEQFDAVYGDSVNYYDYMPRLVAPIAPTVVVTTTEGKDAASINNEFKATVPVASNAALQYLYDAVLGESQEGNVNDHMNDMRLGDVTEVNESSPLLLQRLKNTKIAEISAEANNLKLCEVMEINSESHIILQRVANSNINNLGDDITAQVNSMTLAEATEIDESHHIILQRIKDEPISNIGTAVTEAIGELKLYELVEIRTDADVAYDRANFVATEEERLAAIAAFGTANGGAYDGEKLTWDYFETKEAQQAWIDAQLELDSTNIYYDKATWIRDNENEGKRVFATTIERATAFAEYTAVNADSTMTVEEFGVVMEGVQFAAPYAPEVKEDFVLEGASNRMLQAIRNATPSTLNASITNLTLMDLFGEQTGGAMSLISGYTQLSNIGDAMTDAIQTSTMGDLFEADILTMAENEGDPGIYLGNLDEDTKSELLGSSIVDIVDKYVALLEAAQAMPLP